MVRSISTPALGPSTVPANPAPADLDGKLQAALIESRQRMKELLELACDFAWETDAGGRFSFMTSAGALGYDAYFLPLVR